MTRRVAITGVGFVSSLGPDGPSTWARMLEGDCGIGPLTQLKMPGEPAQMAAEVHLPAGQKLDRRVTRAECIALMALREALRTTPGPKGLDPRRMGAFQGAGTSGLPSAEAYVQARRAGEKPGAVDAIYQSPTTITDALGRELGAAGPWSTVMTACSSSLMALGQAWERIAGGELDLAVAGGAETLCMTTYAGFSSLKAMDSSPCRPFSRDRAGLNLGEGSAQFILEPLDQAMARGAEIFAEVNGYGASLDAHHSTAPHPEGEGAARAIAMAMECAGLNPDDVDFISAHGTATPANDSSETSAIKTALGEAAARISVTSTKSQFGHTLGASGAVAAFAAVMALRTSWLSPTLRLEDPDPACDLDYTPLHARERGVRAALVNAFAFGGNNACLALKRWEGR
ncbi:MAG: beta-ketoacyl-[acyl-carrier-protein] synthase family protein [Acidobacteriota bacterium]|nr:beta-ketoacyl-[acyl-carrier-protein] synthase family protein [Acidobacteriota bacterium]